MSSRQFPSYADVMSCIRVAHSDVARAKRGNTRAQRFDEAMKLMEDGRWRHAFTCLAELADIGHAQAARIAMLFVQRGSLLFGGSFRASAQQRASWQRVGDC